MTTLILICGKKEPQTVNNSLEKMAPIFAFPRTSIIFKLILKTRDVGGLVIFTFPMHRELLTVGVVWEKKTCFHTILFWPTTLQFVACRFCCKHASKMEPISRKSLFPGLSIPPRVFVTSCFISWVISLQQTRSKSFESSRHQAKPLWAKSWKTWDMILVILAKK